MEQGQTERLMQEHAGMMARHRAMTRWVHFANMALGVWLMTSPVTFGYADPASFGPDIARVTAERGLPDPILRATLLAWSDVISGALVVVFASLALSRRHAWAQWANVVVGLWLLFAPLVFWAPSAAAYANDTLVGALIIAFAILVPMMPGMSMQAMAMGPDIPPAWGYTPSSWVQRLPIIVLALVGFFIARYLSAYQLGHLRGAWDPFFGGGTARIITSDVSRAWPIADAGLGAVSYLLEALSGLMGSKRRWRTMPWMVALFGIMVVPLGAISIFFIVIQPVMIGTWCTLCLLAALAMVIMIPYSLDELVAMGQFLLQARRERKPFWRAFFQGEVIGGGKEESTSQLDLPPRALLREMFLGGVNFPWTLLLATAIGVALMFTRLLFGTDGAMANSDHLVGALVVTFTVMAMAEVGRALRFINIGFGAWLIAAPFVLEGANGMATSASIVAGVALILLALPRGPVRNRYGSWDRFII